MTRFVLSLPCRARSSTNRSPEASPPDRADVRVEELTAEWYQPAKRRSKGKERSASTPHSSLPRRNPPSHLISYHDEDGTATTHDISVLKLMLGEIYRRLLFPSKREKGKGELFEGVVIPPKEGRAQLQGSEGQREREGERRTMASFLVIALIAAAT